jgi:hypothetical protein
VAGWAVSTMIVEAHHTLTLQALAEIAPWS